MAKVLVFPAQGAQFVGIGKDLYESNERAMLFFDKADEVLGYSRESLHCAITSARRTMMRRDGLSHWRCRRRKA